MPIEEKIYCTLQVMYIPDESAGLTQSHQFLKYATVFASTSSRLPKYSIFICIYTFLED
jgi:hypothetical protein